MPLLKERTQVNPSCIFVTGAGAEIPEAFSESPLTHSGELCRKIEVLWCLEGVIFELGLPGGCRTSGCGVEVNILGAGREEARNKLDEPLSHVSDMSTLGMLRMIYLES